MRAAREASAIAFERDPARQALIRSNAENLGCPGLIIVAGEAPQSFAGQPAPDAVFLGGDVANEAIFTAAWNALKPGGRLVANSVTLEGEQALVARAEKHGGELVRIDVAVLDMIGRRRVMRPRLPVMQWAVTKP
jgi:precorrin-6Y C5,15-methyltransferase (decarboxylating)